MAELLSPLLPLLVLKYGIVRSDCNISVIKRTLNTLEIKIAWCQKKGYNVKSNSTKNVTRLACKKRPVQSQIFVISHQGDAITLKESAKSTARDSHKQTFNISRRLQPP